MPPKESKQTIVALASMFFGAKLKGLCEQAGYEYKGAIGPSGMIKRIEEFAPVVVLFDLGKEDIDIQATVTAIKEATDVPIIAFCGHVATKELEIARESGCDIVTTNGAITESFDSILSKALEQL